MVAGITINLDASLLRVGRSFITAVARRTLING